MRCLTRNARDNASRIGEEVGLSVSAVIERIRKMEAMGIISGVYSDDGVSMIQFTAPISPGSSGGALLNLYGEVIGICTAGFDNGQNLNLAVGYENIAMFIQGFV